MAAPSGPIDPIVGIDLGTSNTAVSYADDAGTVQVLADDGGTKIHPSVVSFHPNGGVIVGAAAKQRKVIDPANTVFSVKRLIGRRFQSPEVQTAKSRMPYQIKEGGSHMPMIVTRAGEFAVPEVSAIVLDHMKSIATARLGKEIHRAVVTVPASFNDAQRSATATAGAVAGLTIVRVLNEPTAAALAYGHTRGLQQMIAVYDFGGGTFDVTVLKLQDQVYEVLGTAGDSFLGGDDLDEKLVDKMVQKFLVENRIDLRTNEVAMMRLRAVAEQTKIELSRRSRAVVRIDEIAYGPKGAPLNLQIEISRDEFVGEIKSIVDRTFPVCDEALALAGVGVDAIDDVLMVGGTTKIPYVRDQVARFFNKAPRADIPPEEAVSLGAGLQASALERMLARKSSARISAQNPVVTQTGSTVTVPGFDTDPGLETGSDTTVRRTNPYGSARGDTESGTYSMTRPGTRDDFSSDTNAGTNPRAATGGTSLARMKPGTKTQYGVAQGPQKTDPGLEPSALTLMPQPPQPQRTTSPASVPPVPVRQTQAVPVAPPPVPVQRSTAPRAPAARPPAPTGVQPAVGIALADLEDEAAAEAAAKPTTTPGVVPLGPLGPLGPPPIVTSPTAPTLYPTAPAPAMAATLAAAASAPAMFAPAGDEPTSAASTAKGFQPAPAITQRQPVPTVLDVTPRGLGIATVAGYCEELIRRNSRLPAEMVKLFTTSRDKQDTVRIVVCQGESRRLDNNVVIGDLKLENLPPRARGETSIEVTFQLDSSGILRVRARDAKTGKEQQASLDTVGNLSEEQVGQSRDRLAALRR